MAKQYRAMLAVDLDLKSIKYPTGVMPKIDGVRGLNPFGTLLGRSLKRIPNVFTRENFSKPEYQGLDGELACGLETDDDLCRKTTSAVTSIEGAPTVTWHAFDCCHENVAHLPYKQRYEMMKQWVESQQEKGLMLDVSVVPLYIVNNEQELLEWNERWLDLGYEGLIQRGLDAPLKMGRATKKEASYGRIKPYEDTEGFLMEVEEAMENLNEAFVDERGYTKRSSHQDNKVGKGMSGAMIVKRLDTGELVRIGPGKLTHAERYALWPKWQSGEIKPGALIAKFRHFPKGVKIKPRQARFLSWRDPVDLVDYE